MKKQLLRFVSFNFALISTVAIAQPTLTATGINPVIGNSFTLTTTSYFAPGAAGANQTWNFASLTGTAGTPAPVVSVGSTPNGASFPNANIAIDQGGGIYGYQKTSSTALQNYGSVSGTVVIAYTNPEDYLHFPFTFNNTYVDPFAASFSNGGYTFYRRGTSTVTADAYGTLITPAGTFTNVTRIHMVQAYQDSTNFGAPYVITYNNDEYLWYVNGTHSVLAASFSIVTSASPTPSQSGFYLSSGLAGVDEMNPYLSGYNLFPNPAVNNLTIDFNLTENKPVQAKIFNVAGQQVQDALSIEGIQGSNKISFDVSTLPEGIYFAQIMVEGDVAGTRRFVVSK